MNRYIVNFDSKEGYLICVVENGVLHHVKGIDSYSVEVEGTEYAAIDAAKSIREQEYALLNTPSDDMLMPYPMPVNREELVARIMRRMANPPWSISGEEVE